MEHALNQACLAVERQIERLIGKREFIDAISLLVIATHGDTLTIGRLGNGRLWLQRQGWMNTIVSSPTTVISTSEYALKHGDRLVLSTSFIGEYVNSQKISQLLQTHTSNAEVARALVQLADTTGLPQIASAVCLTHSTAAVEPVRSLILIAPKMPSKAEAGSEETLQASQRRVSGITLTIVGFIALLFAALMATVALLSSDAARTAPTDTPAPTAAPSPTLAPTPAVQRPIVLPPTRTPVQAPPTETPLP